MIATFGGGAQNFLATHKDLILPARYHGYLLIGLGALVAIVEAAKWISATLEGET